MDYTKGPWKIGDGNPPLWAWEGWVIIKKDGQDYVLARCNENLPEVFANARLIAQAPDMLEVLKEYIDWGAKTSSDRYYFEEKFREIIAKAT